MTRRLWPMLVAGLLVLNLPFFAIGTAQAATGLAQAMKQVDTYLDTALRNLNSAEELVTKKSMTGVETPMGQVRDAETKIGQALSMFKSVEATKPTKEQLDQVQSVLKQSQDQLKSAVSVLKDSNQKGQNYKLLTGLVTGADRNVGRAMQTLRQMAAGKY